MNACPTFPDTPFGLVVSLIYRIVAFLALCIRGSGLDTRQATTLETRAGIVTFAARLLAVTRNFARPAEHVRRGTQPVRDAGAVARRMLRARGEQRAGDADPRIAAGGARVAGAARGFGVMLPGGSFPTMDKTPAGAPTTACEPAGDCQQRQAPPSPVAKLGRLPATARHISASVLSGRAASSKLALGLVDLSTGSDGGASRASCEFSTGFRNWVRLLGARMTNHGFGGAIKGSMHHARFYGG